MVLGGGGRGWRGEEQSGPGSPQTGGARPGVSGKSGPLGVFFGGSTEWHRSQRVSLVG